MNNCREYLIEMGDSAGRSYITYFRNSEKNSKWQRSKTRSARGAFDYFCNAPVGCIELGDGVLEALIGVENSIMQKESRKEKYTHRNKIGRR